MEIPDTSMVPTWYLVPPPVKAQTHGKVRCAPEQLGLGAPAGSEPWMWDGKGCALGVG